MVTRSAQQRARYGALIIGDKRLKEVDSGSFDVAKDLDLVFKDKRDMAADPILWDGGRGI